MYVLSPFRGVCVCESVGVVGAHVRVCVRVCRAGDGREQGRPFNVVRVCGTG